MSTPVSSDDIRQALADFPDPETGRNAIQMNQLVDVRVDGPKAVVRFAVTTHSFPIWTDVEQNLIQRIRQALPQIESVEVERAEHHRPAPKVGELGVPARSIVAVGSGKGGVGKTHLTFTFDQNIIPDNSIFRFICI